MFPSFYHAFVLQRHPAAAAAALTSIEQMRVLDRFVCYSGGMIDEQGRHLLKTVEQVVRPSLSQPVVIERLYVGFGDGRVLPYRWRARLPTRVYSALYTNHLSSYWQRVGRLRPGVRLIDVRRNFLDFAGRHPGLYSDDRRRSLLDHIAIGGSSFYSRLTFDGDEILHDLRQLHDYLSQPAALLGGEAPMTEPFALLRSRTLEEIVGELTVLPALADTLDEARCPPDGLRVDDLLRRQSNVGTITDRRLPAALAIEAPERTGFTDQRYQSVLAALHRLTLTDFAVEFHIDTTTGQVLPVEQTGIFADRYAPVVGGALAAAPGSSLLAEDDHTPASPLLQEKQRLRLIARDFWGITVRQLAGDPLRPFQLSDPVLRLQILRTDGEEALIALRTAGGEVLHAVHFDFARAALWPRDLAVADTPFGEIPS